MYLFKKELVVGLILLLLGNVVINAQDVDNHDDDDILSSLSIDSDDESPKSGSVSLELIPSSSSGSGSSSSSSSDSKPLSSSDSFDSLNDLSSPLSPTTRRPGIPRLGSGYLLEQFRNFNLPGRVRSLTEHFQRFNARAREFRSGIRINPDSLAYRTGRRISLTLQSLAKRAREWAERRRATAAARASSTSSSSNSIAVGSA